MATSLNKVPFTPAAYVAALEAEGLRVVLEPGWEDRTRTYPFMPVGIMNHHTGSPNTPISTIRDGYEGLPGPLAQVYIPRAAPVPTVVLIAWGSCNHPGSGLRAVYDRTVAGLAPTGWATLPDDQPAFYGNRYYWGCECPGGWGDDQEWDDNQLAAIVGWNVALCRLHGWTADRCIAHGEFTRRKRGDPSFMWTGRLDLRAVVAARLGTQPGPQPPGGDDVRYVKRGDQGSDGVKELQVALRLLGRQLKIDGHYGPATSTALAAVQAELIPPTQPLGAESGDYCGPITWAYLTKALGIPGPQGKRGPEGPAGPAGPPGPASQVVGIIKVEIADTEV